MPRSSRLALCALALLLSLSLYLKGRAPHPSSGGAAFSRAGNDGKGIVVRLAGEFPRPGLYRFANGVSAQTAIKMTLPGARLIFAAGGAPAAPLSSGDVVTLSLHGSEPAVFSVVGMGVKERMLVGIPLDPDRLGDDDWSLLPGIGPVLSARIAADRRKYGAFGTLDGLLRVPGIGPGKIETIRRYF